jgi:glycosyltransferase involved in cell wall biosynthesis
MKILLVNTSYYPQQYGGAERMVKRLADALTPLGLEPEVVCLAPDGRAESTDVDGVPVHRLRLRNVYPLFPAEQRPNILKPLWHAIDSANVAMARELSRVVERVQPAIVHTHNLTGFSPLVWRSLSQRRIPIVHTVHDHYLLCARSTMFFRGQNCASRHCFCAPYSAARLGQSSKVAAVVGVSRFILDRHLAYGAFPNASIRCVIRNPMFAAPPPAPRRDTDGVLRLGYLGRLEATKGIDVLLTATQSLPRSGWSIDVAGIGQPDYETELRARFADANVRFLDQVDARTFFRAIDVLVLPSRSNEALPMVIAEAYASAVPVIGTRVGGIPEIIEEGRTGFLVSPGSPNELAAVLERVIGAPDIVRSMRAACTAAAAQFTPDFIAREYADVYRAIAAPSSEARSATLASTTRLRS